MKRMVFALSLCSLSWSSEVILWPQGQSAVLWPPSCKLSQLSSLYIWIGHLRIASVNLQQPPEQDLSWHLSYCWLSVLVWPVGCLWLSGKIALDPSAIRTTEEDLDLEDLGDLEDSKDLEEEPVRTVLDRSAIKTILERNRGKPGTVFTDCVGTQYKKYIFVQYFRFL